MIDLYVCGFGSSPKSNTVLIYMFAVFICPPSQYRAVYHLRGKHTLKLYEMREKIRYHLRVWPLGLLTIIAQVICVQTRLAQLLPLC